MLDVKDLNIEFHDHLVPGNGCASGQLPYGRRGDRRTGRGIRFRKIHDRTGDRRTFVPP